MGWVFDPGSATETESELFSESRLVSGSESVVEWGSASAQVLAFGFVWDPVQGNLCALWCYRTSPLRGRCSWGPNLVPRTPLV